MPIPKTIHIIWIGDESRRPDRWIETWRSKHPSYQIKVWGNAEFDQTEWRTQSQIDFFLERADYPAIADLMRYEILFNEGGVYVDADSECIRPLDDALLDHKMFACWMSVKDEGKLISNGFLGAEKANPLLGYLIERILKIKYLDRRWSWSKFRWRRAGAWRVIGPHLLTRCWRQLPYPDLHVLPYYTFLPEHYDGHRYEGDGIVYCQHHWGYRDQLQP